MLDYETIREMAEQAAAAAIAMELEPYVPTDETEVLGWNQFPFPFLGSYVPEGWHLVERRLCDATGLGHEDEPALTVAALKQWVIEALDEPKIIGWAVIEAGEFQVVVGKYANVFELA